MGKIKETHTVEKCDEWLSTRTKKKVSTPSSIGRRASISRPLKSIGNILLTQNSPPPPELKTHTKQSKLSNFFRKDLPDFSKSSEESVESSEELPVLSCLASQSEKVSHEDFDLHPSLNINERGDNSVYTSFDDDLPPLSRKKSPGILRKKGDNSKSCHEYFKENTQIEDDGFNTGNTSNKGSLSCEINIQEASEDDHKKHSPYMINKRRKHLICDGKPNTKTTITTLNKKSEMLADSSSSEIYPSDDKDLYIEHQSVHHFKHSINFSNSLASESPLLVSYQMTKENNNVSRKPCDFQDPDFDLELMTEVKKSSSNTVNPGAKCIDSEYGLDFLSEHNFSNHSAEQSNHRNSLSNKSSEETINSKYSDLDITKVTRSNGSFSTCSELTSQSDLSLTTDMISNVKKYRNNTLKRKWSEDTDFGETCFSRTPSSLNSNFELDSEIERVRKSGHLISTQEADKELENFSLESQIDL